MAAAPLCSIIIPVYREGRNIDTCLKALQRQRRIGECEVIVADGDGGSTLDAIARGEPALPPVELVTGRGRARQMNTGAAAARSDKLLFLHVDTFLPPRGLDLVIRTLESYDAGAFSLGVVDAGPLFNTWLAYVNGRKRFSFTPYGDQGLFMTAKVFRAVDGFPDLPLMEDVVMTDRLKRGGFRLKLLHSRVLTSPRRWKRSGYILNFLKNTALYLLFRIGVSAQRLGRLYQPVPDKTSKNF